VDIDPIPDRPSHPRITYLQGSSTAPDVFDRVKAMAASAQRTLVILDSDHSRDHVLAEMNLYADLVSPGSYMIVEDTNVNGHPVLPEFGPGPMEALDDFLSERSDFVIDRSKEKLLITFNPRGYLRKVHPGG
jgi:cephalosporin hydroxylase